MLVRSARALIRRHNKKDIMNRNARTFIVLTLSVARWRAATFIVYGAVQRIPVREVEVKSYHVAVAPSRCRSGRC